MRERHRGITRAQHCSGVLFCFFSLLQLSCSEEPNFRPKTRENVVTATLLGKQKSYRLAEHYTFKVLRMFYIPAFRHKGIRLLEVVTSNLQDVLSEPFCSADAVVLFKKHVKSFIEPFVNRVYRLGFNKYVGTVLYFMYSPTVKHFLPFC